MATEFRLSYAADDINNRLGKIDILAEKSELPKKVSDLTNDSGFVNEHYVLEYAQPKGDYAKKSEVPSSTETWTFTLENGTTVTKAVYVG